MKKVDLNIAAAVIRLKSTKICPGKFKVCDHPKQYDENGILIRTGAYWTIAFCNTDADYYPNRAMILICNSCIAKMMEISKDRIHLRPA